MGSPMAKNLLKTGHKIIVYDVFQEVIDDLKQHGAETAKNPAELASKSNRIITMLPSRFI
jgi:3-hydroxyisobutyrate dehydrogenase-like beta-hydroxyacid dehydrogenase